MIALDARAVLQAVRDGRADDAQMRWAAGALASGAMSDAQAGAFAMAVVTRGMSKDARVALTTAMRDSGAVLAWDLPGPVVDKHSTGGIGDCVSLLLAPMLAAAGAYVPMISGRGLGHTGGTLDKLEAIPGLSTELDEATFRRVVGSVGCAIVAASGDIAPADRRLYAIRDVTATVQSVDLITASILSKKLAAGLEALVLDVKVGTGAFMQTHEDARALAQALTSTANGAGCPTRTLITDMNQPLAPALGNALEVSVVIDVLKGNGKAARLKDVTVALGATLMRLAGLAEDDAIGQAAMLATLESGAAAEKFAQMIHAMGGGASILDRRSLPEASVIMAVPAPSHGYVTRIDGVALGEAVVRLGGGRMRQGDKVDPCVGFSEVVALGAQVAKGQPLAMVHAASEVQANRASVTIGDAIQIGPEAQPGPPLVLERVG